MASNDEKSAAWIKKRAEPSAVDENFKDGFVDMLADRDTLFADIVWAMKKVNTPNYKYKHERNYAQLNKDVLYSDRVSHVIEKVRNKLISI